MIFPRCPFCEAWLLPTSQFRHFTRACLEQVGHVTRIAIHFDAARTCIHPGRVHLAPYVGKSSLLNAVLGSVPAAEIVTEGWFREGGGLLYTSEFMRGTDSPSYLSPR